jgi:EAL domain-containing protein (putative c-di-GMP-specific phosphodiesterase class I)
VIAPDVTYKLEGQPLLEFQPVVDLSDGRLLGMEALLRWDHPRLGRLTPDRLLPQAEVNGDIVPLSRWVLAEACGLAAGWSPSVQLAVNCALSQLRGGLASRTVSAVLEETGLEAGRLTLEITEDTVADGDAFEDLRTLSAMGVQLAVDDVGTNWSSFEPLRRLAVNTVKIDGSFVAGLEPSQGINRLVVETVIHMAHSLGMATIAEGVETAHQVALVKEFDADAAQGWFFAHPMSPDEATTMASSDVVPRFSRTEPTTMVAVRSDAHHVNGHAAKVNGTGAASAGADGDAGGDPDPLGPEATPSDGDEAETGPEVDGAGASSAKAAAEPPKGGTRSAAGGTRGSGGAPGGGKRSSGAKKPTKPSATRKSAAPKRTGGSTD